MARRPLPDEARLQEIRKQAAEALAALDSFDDLVEAFLGADGARADRFGWLAADRPDLVHQMRRGTDFRRSTLRRVMAYIGGDDEKR